MKLVEVAAVVMVTVSPLLMEFTDPTLPLLSKPKEVVGLREGGLTMPSSTKDMPRVE